MSHDGESPTEAATRTVRPPVSRRAFLAAAGAGATAALAGCDAFGGDGTPMAEHPAAAGVADQPYLGIAPADSDRVVVAFEDPSCPACRKFELGAFRRIESDVADADLGTFVFRGYPVVYRWGRPATQALESVFDRDPAAFWKLKTHYYETQAQFSYGTVFDRTEAFLLERTDVDAAGVLTDMREGAYADAVQADLDAGEAAEVDETPSFVLFRDGVHVTTLSGDDSYDAFADALGL